MGSVFLSSPYSFTASYFLVHYYYILLKTSRHGLSVLFEMAEPTTVSQKIGHALAAVLRIDLTPSNLAKNPPILSNEKATGGDSIYSRNSDAYIEEEPTVGHWLAELKPTPSGALGFVSSLFPFTSWIHRYNLKWLYGDLVAGITVGCVVIPQGSELSHNPTCRFNNN